MQDIQRTDRIQTIPPAPGHGKTRFTRLILSLVMVGLVAWPSVMPHAQNAPCRPGVKWLFRSLDMCAEELLSSLEVQGIASISGLAIGPEGGLYFANPAARQIMRMLPDDAGFFNAPEPYLSDLPEPPNGLAYERLSGVWYISSDTMILRAGEGEPQIIVRDLPGGAGGWLGNVRIGPDGRLYAAKAARCDTCSDSDPRRGALLSWALDGSDMRIVARGLHSSYDFAWDTVSGLVYVVDAERDTMRAELNIIDPSQTGSLPDAPPDYGWPRCDSAGQPVPGVEGATAEFCAQTLLPALTFDAASRPMGIVRYEGEAFPELGVGLLVALGGSWNAPVIGGYEIVFVALDAEGKITGTRRFLPNTAINASDAALLRASFYPYHLTALAVSAEGWIYAAVAEGRIYRFRPYIRE